MGRSTDGSYARWRAHRKAQEADRRAGRPPVSQRSTMDDADEYALYDLKTGAIIETARITLREASRRNHLLRGTDYAAMTGSQPLARWVTLKSAQAEQQRFFPKKF